MHRLQTRMPPLHYARRWNSLLTQFLKNMPACLFIQPVANSRLPLPMQKHVFQTLNAWYSWKTTVCVSFWHRSTLSSLIFLFHRSIFIIWTTCHPTIMPCRCWQKTACTVSCGFCPTNRTDNSLCLILCKIRNWKDNLSGKLDCLPERKRASYCTDQAWCSRFEIDQPGKDSYRLRKAGVDTMNFKWSGANCTDTDTCYRRTFSETVAFWDPRCRPHFNWRLQIGSQPKIQLLRKDYNETPVGNLENTIAYVANFPYAPAPGNLPVFDLNEPTEMAEYLISQFI